MMRGHEVFALGLAGIMVSIGRVIGLITLLVLVLGRIDEALWLWN
jgi:hypothetical protein